MKTFGGENMNKIFISLVIGFCIGYFLTSLRPCELIGREALRQELHEAIINPENKRVDDFILVTHMHSKKAVKVIYPLDWGE